MSPTTNTIQYGIREFDLGKDRASEQEYQLIQMPNARLISTVDVPDECYLHFGTPTSPGLDLRDYDQLERDQDSFGQAYLENPAGSSGTLRLLIGIDISADRNENVHVDTISDTVGLEDTTAAPVDPVDSADAAKVEASDSGTGSANAAELTTVGPLITSYSVYWEATGSATLTVESRIDGTWTAIDTVSVSSGSDVEVYPHLPFDDLRAYLDTNRTKVVLTGKGVS